jgi:indolepyruvate ferredoxin oxidoreductase, alpha subunit
MPASACQAAPRCRLKRLDDPLRDDPVASIDQTCVGCGNCGEVAEAAILCPSFYEARVVHNPGPWERRLNRWRQALIGWLMRRRAAGRLEFDGVDSVSVVLPEDPGWPRQRLDGI